MRNSKDGTISRNGNTQSEKGKSSGAKVEDGAGLKIPKRFGVVCQRTRQGIASSPFQTEERFRKRPGSLVLLFERGRLKRPDKGKPSRTRKKGQRSW